jgi:integrase
MPQIVFTKKKVEALPVPKTGLVQHFERLKKGLSLGLCISYGGSKTWRALFYCGGKPVAKALGSWPDMSVEAARNAAFAFDPERAIASSEAGLFKDIAANWVKRYVHKNGLRTRAEIERRLRVYVLPKLGHTPIMEIKRSHVERLLDHIEENHGARTADVVYQNIKSILWHFAEKTDEYTPPLLPRKKARDTTPPRNRILSDDEIRAVWKACDGWSFGGMVRLLLLTAQRRIKVAAMKWSDIDHAGVWTLGESEREKPNAGSLKLPALALDIISSQPRIAGNPHVFPARQGTGCSYNFHKQKKLLDKKLPLGMREWRLHDLRRTARSLMARDGIADNIAERVLGHVIGGVEGVYNRHKYDTEKAAALERLAALIDRIINPQENVVALHARVKAGLLPKS